MLNCLTECLLFKMDLDVYIKQNICKTDIFMTFYEIYNETPQKTKSHLEKNIYGGETRRRTPLLELLVKK